MKDEVNIITHSICCPFNSNEKMKYLTLLKSLLATVALTYVCNFLFLLKAIENDDYLTRDEATLSNVLPSDAERLPTDPSLLTFQRLTQNGIARIEPMVPDPLIKESRKKYDPEYYEKLRKEALKPFTNVTTVGTFTKCKWSKLQSRIL